MRRRILILFLVAWITAFHWCVQGNSTAEAGESLIGKSVYPKAGTISVRSGTEAIATGADLNFPIIVRRVEGNELTIWVSKLKREGQVQREDMLTAGEAIPVFSERFAKNPENLYASYVLSLAWEDLNNIDQAIAVTTQAIIGSKHAVFYNRRGNLWQRKKDYQRAILDYTQSLKLDPKSTSCLFNRGLARSILHQDDLAIADFDAVIRQAPTNHEAYIARGSCWKSKQDEARALSDLTTAIILKPDDPLPYHERGQIYLHQGEYAKALADYDLALKLQRRSSRSGTYLSRGLVWVKLGDFDLALSDFDRAIRLDSRNSAAYNNRGWIHATCPEKEFRDGKAALRDAKLACELAQWKNPHHLSTLGEASAEVGNFDAAIYWQQRAAELQAKLEPADTEFQVGSKARLECYRAKQPFREPGRMDFLKKQSLTPGPK